MDGKDQPAASQMSEKDTPLDHAQDEAMPLVEWALIPMGHCNPEEEYANLIASTNHLEIIFFLKRFQDDLGVVGPEFQANRIDG